MTFTINFGNNTDCLKKCFDIIKELVEEVNLSVDDQGIHLQSMDSSMVCLIDFRIGSDSLEEYHYDDTQRKTVHICISLPVLCKVISCSNAKGNMVFKYEENRETCLSVLFPECDSAFKIKLVDSESDILNTNVEYEDSLTVSASALHKVCKDLSKLGSETLDFSCKDGKLGITSEMDMVDAQFSVTTDATSNNIEKKTFSLAYFGKFTKVGEVTGTANLYFGEGKPMKIEFFDWDLDGMLLQFYLPEKYFDT